MGEKSEKILDTPIIYGIFIAKFSIGGKIIPLFLKK
jgi:hypothetical protein